MNCAQLLPEVLRGKSYQRQMSTYPLKCSLVYICGQLLNSSLNINLLDSKYKLSSLENFLFVCNIKLIPTIKNFKVRYIYMYMKAVCYASLL